MSVKTLKASYFNRGVKKNDTGDYLKAIADFNKSIQINPFI